MFINNTKFFCPIYNVVHLIAHLLDEYGLKRAPSPSLIKGTDIQKRKKTHCH